MSEQKKCPLCSGLLYATWYAAGGRPKLRAVCLSCGYRFNRGKITQLLLQDVNELRREKGLEERKKLRKQHH